MDRFLPLLEWHASAERVIELTEALEGIDVGTVMADSSGIQIGESEDGAIHIENFSIADKAGCVMIEDASTIISPGEKVMLGGESGSGKSTLIRALAGLWPSGSGAIRLPREASTAFLPQRPYLPLGTRRQGLSYPVPDAQFEPADVEAAMRRCGLSHLVRRLDEREVRWDLPLSGGELQRIAFCRLLLHKPAIIVMDEATSALDEESQHSLLSLVREDLSYATVISVAHRSGVEDFHDRKRRRTRGERRPIRCHRSPTLDLLLLLGDRGNRADAVLVIATTLRSRVLTSSVNSAGTVSWGCSGGGTGGGAAVWACALAAIASARIAPSTDAASARADVRRTERMRGLP